MPRLWYPEPYHVEVICHKLAANLFTYEPLPAFQFDGGDPGKLEAALALPRQGGFGQAYYPSWDRKAAVLLRAIIKDHPLIDGNKRLGLTTTLVFLMMNRRYLVVSNEAMVEYALGIAATNGTPPLRPIAKWIRSQTVRIGDLDKVVNKAIELHPDAAERLKEQGDAMRDFAHWFEEYRALEVHVRRQARREGLDQHQLAQLFAEEMMKLV